MLRKPYVIGRWMYSNGVRVPYATQIDQQGYLRIPIGVERRGYKLLARRGDFPASGRVPHANG